MKSLPLTIIAQLLPLLLFVGTQADLVAKQNYELIFDNFTCGSSPSKEFVLSLNCGLSKNTKRSGLQMAVSFARKITAFYFNMLIVSSKNNLNNMVLFNETNVNGCDLLASKPHTPILMMGREQMKRYGNYPYICPFEKETIYFINRFRPELEPMSMGDNDDSVIKITFDFTIDGKKIFEGFVDAHLILKTFNGAKS